VVEAEISPRKEALGLSLSIQEWHVRLYAPAHQPADHQTGSISGISGKTLRMKPQTFLGSLQHRLGCRDFGLPSGRGRFDIDDDRQFGVDQIIGAAGKAELRAAFAGPRRGGIGQGDDLRF
jgi:hypothetical protein